MSDILKPGLAEMIEGYKDGGDRNAPWPSENRSRAYRHGFANRRDDMGLGPCAPHPRESAAKLGEMADEAMNKDAEA